MVFPGPFALAILICILFCGFFLALINISDELKTALQQIKNELTQIKQEMREEHITTRNTSLQGKRAKSLL